MGPVAQLRPGAYGPPGAAVFRTTLCPLNRPARLLVFQESGASDKRKKTCVRLTNAANSFTWALWCSCMSRFVFLSHVRSLEGSFVE